MLTPLLPSHPAAPHLAAIRNRCWWLDSMTRTTALPGGAGARCCGEQQRDWFPGPACDPGPGNRNRKLVPRPATFTRFSAAQPPAGCVVGRPEYARYEGLPPPCQTNAWFRR